MPHFTFMSKLPSISPICRDKPKVFIHVGLHKTGTTALQQYLTYKREELKTKGYLYPFSGIPSDSLGQHNIAWQTAHDRRFRANLGTIDDLAEEIASFGGKCIISSEDFESSLKRSENLSELTNHVLLRNFQFILVVYLRNQIEYFIALYLEMLRHGMANEPCFLIDTIIQTGRICFQEWIFHFDYVGLYANLKRNDSINPIFRCYGELISNSIVTDFFSVIGLDVSDQMFNTLSINARESNIESLKRFLQVRLDREIIEVEAKILEQLGYRLQGKKITISQLLKNRFDRAFRNSNKNLITQTGVSTKILDSQLPDTEVIRLDRLFSFCTQNFISELAGQSYSDTAIGKSLDTFVANLLSAD